MKERGEEGGRLSLPVFPRSLPRDTITDEQRSVTDRVDSGYPASIVSRDARDGSVIVPRHILVCSSPPWSRLTFAWGVVSCSRRCLQFKSPTLTLI